MAGPLPRRRTRRPATRRLQIRLTEQEHETIRRAPAGVSKRGVSMSRYVAEAALAAAGSAPPPRRVLGAPTKLVLAEVAAAVAAVNRVGNNLNQLARERNATGFRPTGTAEEVARALAALERLAEVAEERSP